MKRKRMISRQLFFAQIIIVEALCLTAALAFYAYNAATLKNSEKARLASLCSDTTAQIDAMVHSMDVLSISILTADGFVPAMRGMAFSDGGDYGAVLREIMAKAYVSNTGIYRVIALSPNGNAVSIGRNELSRKEAAALVADGYWHQTDRRGSSKVLHGPFDDPWMKNGPKEVFSLLRAVRDGEDLLGYIEIQMLTDHIKSIYQNQWWYNDLYFVIITGGDELFLSNFNPDENSGYIKSVIENAAWYPTDSIETGGEIISISASNYTDWKNAIIMPKSALYGSLYGVLRIAIVFSVLMGLGIAFFFWLIVEKITKPISKVVGQVEQISLENLDAPFEYVAGGYEVEVLSDAFGMMKSRLAEAFRHEKAVERMQAKTLLEALQSRISPHFLYNTLNSISNMCEAGNAQEAADACFHLSDLLRYSSNYTTGLVTIREELEHLRDYLALMKGRYQHRLCYEISADESCMDTKIPKLTIQPIVENAIKYSLTEAEQVRVGLNIAGNDGGVCILVTDNGVGFDGSVLESLAETLGSFLKEPTRFSLDEAVPLRGMGLAGTLMRLYLIFGAERFHYEISNRQGGGASVELRIGQ